MKWMQLKTAGILAISMNVLAILVHVLVLLGVIPYLWINGGRSVDFAAATQTSLSSIPILAVGCVVPLLGSQLLPIRLGRVSRRIVGILLWLGVAYSAFGLVLQLLGTPFEKVCMSVIVLVSLVAGLRLAVEKRG